MDNITLPNPADLPERYGLILRGDNLEPELADGTCLVFSTTEQPEIHDFVVAYFKPGVRTPYDGRNGVFRLGMDTMPGVTFPFKDSPTSEVHPLIMLETLSPRRRAYFRADAILALHKVIGRAQPDGSGVIYFGEEEAQA